MAVGFSDENLAILRKHLEKVGKRPLPPCPICQSAVATANGIYAKWVYHEETSAVGPETQPTVQILCPTCFLIRFEFPWVLVKKAATDERV